jgi:hypothetical protein
MTDVVTTPAQALARYLTAASQAHADLSVSHGRSRSIGLPRRPSFTDDGEVVF